MRREEEMEEGGKGREIERGGGEWTSPRNRGKTEL